MQEFGDKCPYDGELRIYRLEDRMALFAILARNGYDVGQHQRKKSSTSNALDYFVHYTLIEGNTVSK